MIDTIDYKDMDTGKYVQTKVIHTGVGQSLDLTTIHEETEQETDVSKVYIAALTDRSPMGMNLVGRGGLNIVVSEQVLNQLADDKSGEFVQTFLYLKSADPLKTQQEIEDMKEPNLYAYNVYQSENRKNR